MLSPFIEEALSAIESKNLDTVAVGFLTLGEVIACNRIQGFRSDIVPEANKQILEWGPLEHIQQRIQRWIEANPNHPSVRSAFWALDKFRDKALRPFLRHWLDYYVQKVVPHMGPVGQILVDLNSLGEQSISGSSFSATDHGKNLNDSITYLRSHAPKA
jgi:hypothetical protein